MKRGILKTTISLACSLGVIAGIGAAVHFRKEIGTWVTATAWPAIVEFFTPEEKPNTPPDVPDTPDVPDVPDTPNVPDTPDVPEVPDTPDVPVEPDVPDIQKLNLEYDEASLLTSLSTKSITELPKDLIKVGEHYYFIFNKEYLKVSLQLPEENIICEYKESQKEIHNYNVCAMLQFCFDNNYILDRTITKDFGQDYFSRYPNLINEFNTLIGEDLNNLLYLHNRIDNKETKTGTFGVYVEGKDLEYLINFKFSYNDYFDPFVFVKIFQSYNDYLSGDRQLEYTYSYEDFDGTTKTISNLEVTFEKIVGNKI